MLDTNKKVTCFCQKKDSPGGKLEDAIQNVIKSDVSQNAKPDDFRTSIRASEPVSQISDLTTNAKRRQVAGTFYAAWPRRRHQLIATNISSTKVGGSGTAEFAPAPAPEWLPKFDFHTL
jgi:hypothetical protein